MATAPRSNPFTESETTNGVECLFMPFGTVLGVFTIVVLCREPVKQLFSARPSGPEI